MEDEKYVDESWKENVSQEKDEVINKDSVIETQSDEGMVSNNESFADQEMPEVNFFTYISSLVFQSMIFLGEIPNPLTNKEEKNLKQSKFLIDTLALIKEKTTGNLNKEEEEIISSSLYELQMKYVQIVQKEGVK